jgi:hypothetical protein
VQPDNIPAELKEHTHWVAWQYVWKNGKNGGKWDKPPVNCNTGGPAASTEPKTWVTFDRAMTYYADNPSKVDGIGFALSKKEPHADPFVGIDLDDCVNAETGAILPWAQKIIDRLGTYVEISPSRTGLRAFVRGQLPPSGRKKGAYENYETGRYVTVTGQRLPGYPATIADRQAVLNELHRDIFGEQNAAAASRPQLPPALDMTDEELIEKAKRAGNGSGERFARLWAGDISGYASHSEADLALYSTLLFWTQGDQARADRLFRASGLYREEKWGRADYRARTFAKAMEGKTEFYKPQRGARISAVKAHRNGAATVETSKRTATAEQDDADKEGLANYFVAGWVKVGLPAHSIAEQLLRVTNGWPKRTGQLLFVADGTTPHYLEDATDLFGWINKAWPHRDGARGVNPIRWAKGEDKLSQSHFDAYLRQTVENFAAVNAYPHEPGMAGHFYLHPEPTGGDGRAFAALLGKYNPATEVDRDLIRCFFLSLFWGGEPGQRPGFLITAPDDDPKQGRGVGKSTLVKHGAKLCGGLIECSANDGMDDIKKRMLSPEGRGKRVLLIDNVKTHKFSWAELEGFITAATISGRQLYVGEGQLPNLFTVGITVNGATLSKDLAQRCVIAQMKRPEYSATWELDTVQFIDKYRWAIIGDILAILRSSGKPLRKFSRWGLWEQSVLAHAADPEACQAIIEARQDAVDDDQDEHDLVRDAFIEAMREQGRVAATSVVLIPSRVAADLVERATGERRPVNKASAYLKTLGITELRKSDRAKFRGFVWHGEKAAIDQHAEELDTRGWRW